MFLILNKKTLKIVINDTLTFLFTFFKKTLIFFFSVCFLERDVTLILNIIDQHQCITHWIP